MNSATGADETGLVVDDHGRAPHRTRRFGIRILAWLLVVAFVPLAAVVSGEGEPAEAQTIATQETTFAAGSYIIDMGAFTTTKPTGLRPYGILYDLLANQRTPVAWVIKDGKAGGNADTGLPPLAAQTPDFSATVVVDGAGNANATPVQTKAYRTGAFVIAREFVTPQVDALLNSPLFSAVIVDRATVAFDAPVFKRLTYWPKAVLDAQNGSIAQGFFTNAGVPNLPKAYSFKAPSQLSSCDDIYVMPHADPTWATHQNLKSFNDQGGYIWAACHAVSVLESVVNPFNPVNERLNFLSTEGLLNYKEHGAGTPPYSYHEHGSDPIMQLGGPIDAAQLNGSEQIFMPKPGSAWRGSSRNITWDKTQADVPSKSPGEARTLTYGRGYGKPGNGMVMYEGGHSINKGSVGDVPAQRAFFNFLLLGGSDRAPSATVNASSGQVQSGATTTLTANVSGGDPGYNYQWSSTCAGGSFSSQSGFSGTGTISTLYTAPLVTSGQTCAIQVQITDQCGRTPFGATSIQVVPSADVAITKTVDRATVGVNGALVYTLTVRNNGSGTATAPTVTDVLPPGTEYLSATPAPTSVTGNTTTGQTLTWSRPDLAVNATSTITINARALTPGSTLTNRASVSSSTPDPNTANNSATAITQVLNSGISIEKTARPRIVGPSGGPVTFEFVVRNTGTDPLTDIVVTDNPGCTITGPTGDLNGDGILAPALSGVQTEVWRYTCSRTVTTATGDVAQSASGISTGVPPLDTGAGSNFTKQDVVQVTAKDPLGNSLTSVAHATVTISNPSIAVTKTLSPANQRPAPGGKATFAVTVTNTGNVPLVNVATADVWPGSCTNNSTIPTIAVGGSYAMTCDATLPSPGTISDDFGSGTPYSYATGQGWAGGWVDSHNGSASAGEMFVTDAAAAGLPTGYSTPNVLRFGGNSNRTLTRPVDLAGRSSVSLRFSYNRTAAYNDDTRNLRLRWSNDGVTFTDLGAVPQSGTNTADSGWTVFEASIPAPPGGFSSSARIQFFAQSDLRSDVVYLDDVHVNEVNSVTATARDAYGTLVTAAATANVLSGIPSLAITKTASRSTLRAGDTLDYSVTVTNNSSVQQTGITVADALPAGLALNGAVTVSRPAYPVLAQDNFGTGTPAYNTGTGWTGAWTETVGDTNSDPTGGRIRVVTGVGNPPNSLFLDPNNNTYSITRTANLAGAPAAQLSIDCSRESPNSANDEIVIAIGNATVGYQTVHTVPGSATSDCPTNQGSTWGTITVPVPASALVNNAEVRVVATGDKKFWFDNLVITGQVPATSVTAGSPPTLTSAGGNDGTASAYALAPGASMTFTIPVRVDTAPADGYQFSNTASATSTQQTGSVAAVATTPYLAPDYTITKEAIETWVNGSGNVTYRIELRNTGNVALTGVVVNDPACNAAPVLVSGDLNGDSRLQRGETWRYECTRTVTQPLVPGSPPTPAVVPNTASATMTDAISGTAVAVKTASAQVRVVHPSITIAPTPSSTVIPAGETVTYTYTVANTGDIGIVDVSPTAGNCSPLAYQSGDANGDGILNTTEEWVYTCTTGPITSNQIGSPVAVAGKDRVFGGAVTDGGNVDVNVYVTPELILTKTVTDSVSNQSGTDITVGAGNVITYSYTVENPFSSPAAGLPLANVRVADDGCSPVEARRSGGFVVGDDNENDLLDLGETWEFECVGGSLSTSRTSSAFATGDYFVGGGGTVSSNQASTTVTVALPQLTLGKETSSETIRTGASVTYTFTVLNTGATSFDLDGAGSYLGNPSDVIVEDDGTITDDPACASITGPHFPPGAPNDGNLNGRLDPGEMVFYTCTGPLDAATTDAFQLGQSRDTLGTLHTPVPAIAQVFVIDPTFTTEKVAQTSLDGPGTAVTGVPGQRVDYTITVTNTTTVYGDFRDGLASLELSVEDPTCDPGTLEFVSGDANDNGLFDPGEVHVYTCVLAALPDDPDLPDYPNTVNVVTVTGKVVARDENPDGTPANPDDGLEDIVDTATATVSPATRKVTVRKQGLYCDVGQPVCDSDFPGTAFEVFTADPTDPALDPAPTGTPLDPAAGGTFETELIINNDYWLVETRAPEGFQLLAQPVRFRVTPSGLTLHGSTASPLITANPAGAFTITVTDVPKAELPEAGGHGVWPYVGLGLLLFLGACLLSAGAARSPRERRGRQT